MTLGQAQTNLQAVFAGEKIPTQVAVTSYAIKPDTAPYLFNWRSAGNSSDEDYYVWEAALATSAAPVYFPLAHVGGGVTMANVPTGQTAPTGSSAKERWVVDGGVVANDPVMFAYAQAAASGCDMSNPLIVSLGTGAYDGIIQVPQNTFDTGNWGSSMWFDVLYDDQVDVNGKPLTVPAIVGVLASNEQAPEMQIQCLVPQGNYLRLEPPLTYAQAPMDLNDASALQTVASDYIAQGGGGYDTFQAMVAAVKS